MRYTLAFIIPCALALSACTSVTPAFKDIGTRSGPCVDGGPDKVAQQFYDTRIEKRGGDLNTLRPWLSDSLAKLLDDASRDPQRSALLRSDLFSGRGVVPESADVASASTIPNTDARNIPLRVRLKQGDTRWQDEVLMTREGQCWAVDDIRYASGGGQAPAGTLRQSLEKR